MTSVIDIGCADGVSRRQLGPQTSYRGIDVGADIYARTSDSSVTYIEDAACLEEELRRQKPAHTVFIFDVLEHTNTFVSLFDIGLELAERQVFVSLPNEVNLRHAMHMLFDELPGAHGVRMVGSKPGHRHQWLINCAGAIDVLVPRARHHGFTLERILHIMNMSPSLGRRLARRLVMSPLPLRLQSDQFALLFVRQ
ncbi:hypothetical protein [Rhodovulum sp. PH10]|uniref:hypothetical protein n=1 Tax=Rhodovulum sp. PH10 TaxID=1187851 RepID=UPI0005913F4B|nr:hypothetical protein [Rhodovulum sp. PH10]